MAPRYKTLSGRGISKALIKHFGFSFVRQKGSHIVLTKQLTERKITTVVPDHKEVRRGTLRGVLKLAEVDEDEFFRVI